jgi:hypothetical protein
MIRTRFTLAASAAAALILGACEKNEPEKAQPTEPAAPAAVAPAASADIAPSVAALGAGKPSSVCRTYQRKRDKITALAQQAPGDQKLKTQVQALNKIIKEACN